MVDLLEDCCVHWLNEGLQYEIEDLCFEIVDLREEVRDHRGDIGHCGDHSHSHIVNRKLRIAATDLKTHKVIIVRHENKSSCYVFMDRVEYRKNLDSILSASENFSTKTRTPHFRRKKN